MVIETLARDVAFALRGFRRTPLVTMTLIATIALALGVNAALFTIFNAYVFRTEAVEDPGTLFRYTSSTSQGEKRFFTFREYESFRLENALFSDVAARRMEVTPRIEGRTATGQLVTGNFFQVLGVGAAHGRMLTPADAIAPGREPVVVLSHLGWQRLYGGDATVIGRAIRINGCNCTIVGIAPEGFLGLDLFPADFWAPLTLISQIKPLPGEPADNPRSLEMLGRLKPGMSQDRARALPEPSGARVHLYPTGTAAPLSAWTLLAFSPLFAGFALVLLIACANVANLMLARAFAREREIGIRLSIGASRPGVIRQLLTESLLVALAAALCALLISRAVVDTATHFLFATMPAELAEFLRLAPLPTDFRIAAFTIAAAVVSALFFGLLPALRATRLNLAGAVRGDFARDGGRPGRTRSTLIVMQVTASALLLITAAVVLRGALRAAAEDPGLRVSDTVVINLNDQSPASEIVAALAADPGVRSFAGVWPGMPIESLPRQAFASPAGTDGEQPTSYRFVSPEYFEVIGLDMIQGRPFTREEAVSRSGVAVVSESAARRFWPDGNVVGRLLRLRPGDGPRYREDLAVPSIGVPQTAAPGVVTVIGVARDVAGYRLAGNKRNATPIYLPLPGLEAGKDFIVRVNGDTEIARRALVDRLTRIAPDLPGVFKMSTFGELSSYPLAVVFWITAVLGALTLSLTLSGIYGVLSCLVVQRTKEVGVRMALGATAGAVTRLVLWQSLRLVGIGITIGASLALVVSKLLVSVPAAAQLAQVVDPLDAAAYAGSVLSIIAACAAAALVPALRAARIDPIATLHHD